MTADQELERVVAWLRVNGRRQLKAKGWPLSVRFRAAFAAFRQPLGFCGAAYDVAANALARHEHRSEADG